MRKTILLLIVTGHLFTSILSQSVGIGTATPDASAQLDISSTIKGMLAPRMTSAQRQAIVSPASGLMVFDINTASFWFKGNTNWVELVDTLNNNWKKSGNDVYLRSPGKVGIGNNNPGHPLDIYTSDAAGGYAMRLRNPNTAIGTKTILLLSSNIVNNPATLGASAITSITSGGQGQHLTFSTVSTVLSAPVERMRIDSSGNVGIGIDNPDLKLHVSNGSDVGGSSGGFLQLGSSSSINVGFDNNEIQARNNAVASKLFLQNSGGGLQIGGNTNINITASAQVYRNLPLSANADLLPIAYGRVDAFGNVLSGTGNFSVQPISDGIFRIVLPAEADLYLNRDNYTILLTSNSTGNPVMIMGEIQADNSIQVRTARPWVSFTNSACGCSTTSYIQNSAFYDSYSRPFSILIYKM